jgi:Uma2 family endonuclease
VLPLYGVSYDYYQQIRRAPGNRLLRMTYHDGTLEIMLPQYRHEKYSRRIGLVVLAVTSVLGIPCQGTGSTTFSRRGPQMSQGWGKEPDQCFYLTHESRIRGKDEINLEVDPHPDLWIEVEHRGSSRGRMQFYAALGVPEIWRFRPRHQQLWFGSLQECTYVEVVRSLALPMLTPELVLEALNLGADLPESQWDPLLRNWIQGRLSPA